MYIEKLVGWLEINSLGLRANALALLIVLYGKGIKANGRINQETLGPDLNHTFIRFNRVFVNTTVSNVICAIKIVTLINSLCTWDTQCQFSFVNQEIELAY